MALLPQYVNIQRDQLLFAVTALYLVPLVILKSERSFLNFCERLRHLFWSNVSFAHDHLAATYCKVLRSWHSTFGSPTAGKYDAPALYQLDDIYRY